MKWLAGFLFSLIVVVSIALIGAMGWELADYLIGSGYRGPGDLVPGATAYYGLRAYDAAYAKPGTNKAIEIRRASDNDFLDIDILRSGSLDTTAASAFCASTVCYIAKWFDQSGNGNDIRQDVEGEQPELVLNGNGTKPAVRFDYSRTTYLAGYFPWVSGNEPWAGQVALLTVAPINWYEPIFLYGLTSPNQSLAALVHESYAYQFSTSIYGTEELSGIPSTAPAALTFYSTGSAVGGYINGQNWTQPFAASDITGNAFSLGGSPTQSGIWLNGAVGEVILYASPLDAAAAGKLAASERKYYGF